MFKKYRDLIIYLFKPFTKQFILLAFLLTVVAIIDALIPKFTAYAIDHFITPKVTDGLPGYIALYGTTILSFGIMIILFIVVSGKMESSIGYRLRKEAFNRMQDFKFSYFDDEGVGKVLSKITSDVEKLSSIITWGLVDLTWSIIFMAIILVVMFFTHWQLAILVSLIIPILIFVSYFFQKRIFKTQKEVRHLNSEVIRLINEGITGAVTSKTLVTEDKNSDEFKVVTDDMQGKSVRSSTLSSIYMPMALNIGSIGVATVIVAGGFYLGERSLSLGDLILFITYATYFFDPITQIARVISEVAAAQAAAERVLGHLSQEKSLHVEHPADEFDIEGSIEFKNVNFSYDEREVVLDNFSLKVNAGEKIALVGETGSGKSTIVNLICKFYAPSEGDMYLDGVNYSQLEKEFIQSNLGYVLQTPQLFSGNIRENIRYGRLEATDEEVEMAAKLAQCEEFIHKLDDGYDTKVGEGGAKLSSGEKQLISIARAILANPRIFVLDEATSSIDVNTERKIQKAIENVLSNRTSFIIAHRLSTVKFVDRIILIADGKIKEMGSHRELMNHKGEYYHLYMNQFA